MSPIISPAVTGEVNGEVSANSVATSMPVRPVFNRVQPGDAPATYATAVMVEYNHDEERLARIEQMVERLQREQTALRVLTGKLVAAVAFLKPSVVVTYDRRRRQKPARRTEAGPDL
jgi:hypothetical protein